jgi:PAS domain-containing protein
MNEEQEKRSATSNLRRRAEARLIGKGKGQWDAVGDRMTAADTQRLIQELQIYQIELEMQNEELKQAQDQAEGEKQRYEDLFSFAPVAYFTLDRDSVICRMNFAGGRLLGIDHVLPFSRKFRHFVSESDRPTFDNFLKKVFESRLKKRCNITLGQEGHRRLHVRIEATAARDRQECRTAVLDMTKQKNAEEKLQTFRKELEQRVAEGTVPPFTERDTLSTSNPYCSQQIEGFVL